MADPLNYYPRYAVPEHPVKKFLGTVVLYGSLLAASVGMAYAAHCHSKAAAERRERQKQEEQEQKRPLERIAESVFDNLPK